MIILIKIFAVVIFLYLFSGVIFSSVFLFAHFTEAMIDSPWKKHYEILKHISLIVLWPLLFVTDWRWKE